MAAKSARAALRIVAAVLFAVCCTWSSLRSPWSVHQRGNQSSFCHGIGTHRRGIPHGRKRLAACRGNLARRVTSPSWIEIGKGPELQPHANATVLPMFPSPTLVWPDNIVQLAVVEPSQRKLYEHMLLTGSRTVLAPLARLPRTPGTCEDPEDSQDLNEKCWLQSTAAVLHLEELKDMSEQTGGKMKYAARHSVVGRASIDQVLNPSALFETDANQERTDYLRAEVTMLRDDENGFLQRAESHRKSVEQLGKAWDEVRDLAGRLDEPRMHENQTLRENVVGASTWRLAGLWHKLRIRVQSHREQARIATAVNAWIQSEQDKGRLHSSPGAALEAMPRALLEEVTRINSPIGLKFGLEFYEPFLRLFAADSAEDRNALLLQMARDEVKNVRARVSIHDVLE